MKPWRDFTLEVLKTSAVDVLGSSRKTRSFLTTKMSSTGDCMCCKLSKGIIWQKLDKESFWHLYTCLIASTAENVWKLFQSRQHYINTVLLDLPNLWLGSINLHRLNRKWRIMLEHLRIVLCLYFLITDWVSWKYPFHETPIIAILSRGSFRESWYRVARSGFIWQTDIHTNQSEAPRTAPRHSTWRWLIAGCGSWGASRV